MEIRRGRPPQTRRPAPTGIRGRFRCVLAVRRHTSRRTNPCGEGGRACRPGELDGRGELDPGQQPDAPVGHIDLPPPQAVPRRCREGVVVVMPALTVGQQRNPPQVCRAVAGRIGSCSPDVGCGVDQPGRVQEQDRPDEPPPDQPGHTACGIEAGTQEYGEDEMPPVEPDMDAVAGEVGGPPARDSDTAQGLGSGNIHQSRWAQAKLRRGLCTSPSSSA